MRVLFIPFAFALAALLLSTPAHCESTPRFRPNQTKITQAMQEISDVHPLTVRLKQHLPEGYEINRGAPSQIEVRGGDELLLSQPIHKPDESHTLVKAFSGKTLTVDTTTYYCKKVGGSVCLIKSFEFTVPLKISLTAQSVIELTADLPPEEQH